MTQNSSQAPRHPPFPYPGGKKRYTSWILSCVPDHRTYVEVFGGSGALLTAKERSKIEIYNDINGDLVTFFEVLRESPEELTDWLYKTPYSRKLYSKWVREWQDGERPDNRVTYAGQFFYLRCTQFSAKTGQIAGFKTSKSRPEAAEYHNRIGRLEKHAERFQSVVIEQLDWRDILSKYDGEETVFYLDPPYLDNSGIYGTGEFDHGGFFESIQTLNADWLVSFQEVPDALEGYHADSYHSEYKMGQNGNGSEHDRAMTEYLITNFDPDDRPVFQSAEQRTLSELTTEAGQ